MPIADQNRPDTSIDEQRIPNHQEIDRGTRKKNRNENNWKKNIRKKQVNTGQRGRSNKDDHGRGIRPACKSTCRLKCTTKLNENERKQIHENFWGMNDKSRRRDFVVSHVNRFDKKRSTVICESRRKFSATYTLPKSTSTVCVCKTFFLNTLDISDFMVKYNLDKSSNGIIPPVPKRVPHNKTPLDQFQEVVDHINSFPRVDSHFCRSDTKREYLEATLTTKMMYRFYMEQCLQNNSVPVKESMYRKIFVENFNIGFHKPGKDICDTCTRFEVLKKSELLTQAQQVEWDEHLKRKNEARDSKNVDKIPSDNRVTSIFDLQQVLSAPRLNVGSAYYLRKLNVYNLTVLNVNSMDGHCFTWNESVASRGANEISSVLYLWLNQNDISGRNKAILYSDTCGGQNRNRIVCTAIVQFLFKSTHIETVEQKFFEPGHSQNECDSMHSAIEGMVRKTCKVELPSGYIPIFKAANKDQPYNVTELRRKDIKDFEHLNDISFKQAAFSGIMSARHIVYNKKTVKDSKSRKTKTEVTVSFSDNIGGELEEKSFRKRGSPVDFNKVVLELAYGGQRLIDTKKKADIIKLCEYISPDCEAFYQSLREYIGDE